MKSQQCQELLRIYESLKSQRQPWESWWRNLRKYVLPHRPSDSTTWTTQLPEGNEELLDTTAVEACQKLASGHMSYITPSHDVWFKWSSPDDLGGDEAEAWYNACSEIALKELTGSNFYTEMHECFLDRVAFGTGSLFIGTNQQGQLNFKNIPCGQFVCAENDDSVIDVYMREFSLSGYQAERQFGMDKLGERVKKGIQTAQNPFGVSFRFLHIVKARKKSSAHSSLSMAYESIYISLDDQIIVEKGGYEEFPYLVTRFLKWGEGPYGISPGRLVFPAIKQTQFLNRILDALGEVAAFPRILELANQIGEVDLRAGGRTIVTPEAASLHLPREWATQGRYDIGLSRLEHKQDTIRRAYFLPMLELWAGRTSGVTATEVMARENERVLLFSPSFTLFVSDLNRAMKRIFALLFRQGKFPAPPQSVIRPSKQGDYVIHEPQVVYQSKIALILRRLQNEGIDRSLQRLSMMGQWKPDLSTHIDWDKCFRQTARSEGLPESVLIPQKQIDEQRQMMQQQEISNTDNEQQAHPLLAQLTQLDYES